MPDTDIRPIYQRTFVFDGKTETAEYPAASPHEIVTAALKYQNISPRDFATFEHWSAALDEANDFATFCVAETLDETGEWCDPTVSFVTLWSAFISR
jgi:hypothetical protein